MELKYGDWWQDVGKNFVWLTDNISNLRLVLIHLVQSKVISFSEYERISAGTTNCEKNASLFRLLGRKDWSKIKPTFLRVLRSTGNNHCADKVESFGYPTDKYWTNFGILTDFIQSGKWWPEEKHLPLAFLERKVMKEFGGTILNQRIWLTGLGGVGKSKTAVWFAKRHRDSYEKILWIDGLEVNFLRSFQNLASCMGVKKSHEFQLKELSSKCYDKLRNYRCLFIFDNVESYDVIKDLLPEKDNKDFHVVITSRNRLYEEHGIFEHHVDTFTEAESVKFMKRHLKYVRMQDNMLSIVCELLGHFPLTLQIAVSTLNHKKMSLSDYIDKLRATDYILHSKFDDYEKNIYNSMEITLDIIKNHQPYDGGLTYQILTIFGYIDPNGINLDLFRSIFKAKLEQQKKTNDAVFEEAVYLFQKYFLITEIRTKSQNRLIKINRLIQQVIRRNNKDGENETLRSILKCQGYLEYKLLPYSLANHDLQQEFHNVQSEFVVKLQLIPLLKERRFQEAVELSRIINITYHNKTHLFNYAVCLIYNYDINKSKEVLELLLLKSKLSKDVDLYINHFRSFGLVNAENVLTNEVVIGQLFLVYCLERAMEKARRLILKSDEILLPVESQENIISSLNDLLLTNYFLKYDGFLQIITLTLENPDASRRFELSYCSVDENTKLPKDLQDLILTHVNVKGWGTIEWNIDKLFLNGVNFQAKTKIQVTEMTIWDAFVDISFLPLTLRKLKLDFCTLMKYKNNANEIISFPNTLQHLTLRGISVVDVSGQRLSEFNVSNWILSNVDHFTSYCESNNFYSTTRLTISMKCLPKIQSLNLENCHLILNPSEHITLNQLTIRNVTVKNEILWNEFVEQVKRQGMSIDLLEPTKKDDITLLKTSQLSGRKKRWRQMEKGNYFKIQMAILSKSKKSSEFSKVSLSGQVPGSSGMESKVN